MTIYDYLKDDDRTYCYIGTILDTLLEGAPLEGTGRAIAAQLLNTGYHTITMADAIDANGFYASKRYVTYKNGPYIEEIVLKRLDSK